jgi:hypothetical protein
MRKLILGYMYGAARPYLGEQMYQGYLGIIIIINSTSGITINIMQTLARS